MTNFNWKILETVIEGGILKRVKYWCQGADGHNVVETEGNWTMQIQHQVTDDTMEEQVAEWLDFDAIQSGKHLIKYRLQEQLDALSSAATTKPPWAVDTFKVTI
jgi:hypothetical protein